MMFNINFKPQTLTHTYTLQRDRQLLEEEHCFEWAFVLKPIELNSIEMINSFSSASASALVRFEYAKVSELLRETAKTVS